VEVGGATPGGEALDHPLRVIRRSIYDEETLLIDGAACGKVQYAQRSTGIDLEVHCEKLNVAPPPSRAFVDPDDPDRGCGAAAEPTPVAPSGGSPPP
ncbi:MAG: hypothetical protein JRI68_31670, partial [Deltaproteobacteria bacterium]|nr:hypothetical protein [Deltaproteobacteria bacterium]